MTSTEPGVTEATQAAYVGADQWVEDVEAFKNTFARLRAAFVDYCELTGQGDDATYDQVHDIDYLDHGITFAYLTFGREPRYDGWKSDEITMPWNFLTDPAVREELVAAKAARDREAAAAERRRKREDAKKRRKAAAAKEEKERQDLERLIGKYGVPSGD